MQPFQERVVDEKTDLDGKIKRLTGFFHSDVFKQLPDDEQERMHEQLSYMLQYTNVLERRIAAFGD